MKAISMMLLVGVVLVVAMFVLPLFLGKPVQVNTALPGSTQYNQQCAGEAVCSQVIAEDGSRVENPVIAGAVGSVTMNNPVADTDGLPNDGSVLFVHNLLPIMVVLGIALVGALSVFKG